MKKQRMLLSTALLIFLTAMNVIPVYAQYSMRLEKDFPLAQIAEVPVAITFKLYDGPISASVVAEQDFTSGQWAVDYDFTRWKSGSFSADDMVRVIVDFTNTFTLTSTMDLHMEMYFDGIKRGAREKVKQEAWALFSEETVIANSIIDSGVTTSMLENGAVTDEKITGLIDGGKLGTHNHSADDINSGIVAQTYIDLAIARDTEIMPAVLSLDGSGSGLNADFLDGQDSTVFATATSISALDSRITTLENQSGGSQDPMTIIINAAAVASVQTVNRKPELEIWIRAAQKAGTLLGGITELDTDGDGFISGSDLDNNALASAGVVTTFVSARLAMNEKSPWNSANPLWVNGGSEGNQSDCNTVAAGNPGQITLCYYATEDNQILVIFISVADDAGNIIYQNFVNGETYIETLDIMLSNVINNVSEIEEWIRAAKDGRAANTWVDTDGNGTVVIGTDLTNAALATAYGNANGLCTVYVAAAPRLGGTVHAIRSPWNGNVDLWRAAAPGNGFISCTHPANGTIFLEGQDNIGNTIYQNMVFVETYKETLDIMLSLIKDEDSELEKWMSAADRAGTAEGILREIDTDGNGNVNAADLTNDALATAYGNANGLCAIYVAAAPRLGGTANAIRSPWNGAVDLWQAAAPGNGFISCTHAANGAVTLEGRDNSGNTIYVKTVSGGIAPRERIDSVLKSLDETLPVLSRWITAAQKAGTAEGSITEIDTNGDGIVLAGTDLTNDDLAAAGIITQFISARDNMIEYSPWGGYMSLWVNGYNVANQTACNSVAAGHTGQITLCYYPSEDETVQTVFVAAADGNATVFYQKIITAY